MPRAVRLYSFSHDKVSVNPPSRDEEVSKIRKVFLNKAVIAALATAACIGTLGGTPLARISSHYSHKSLSDEIEKAQIKSVSESLQIVLTGPNRGEKSRKLVLLSLKPLKEGLLLAYRMEKGVVAGREVRSTAGIIAEKVLKIHSKVVKLARGESIGGGIEGLRRDLKVVMSHPFYQSIENQDCEAANFLQFLAVKLIGADGTEALKNYGKKCLGDLNDQASSPIQLADFLSSYLANSSASSKAGGWIWAACHPLALMHSLDSKYDPLGCDEGEGNPSFSAHAFSVEGKKMTFYYGPRPTGNPIFEHGVLPAYKKCKVFELRFNFQDACYRAEYRSIQEIQRMSNQNPEVFRHAVLGFDTKMKNNKAVEFDDSDTFFASYSKYVKNGVRGEDGGQSQSGFQIPLRLLSDTQVDTAMAKAQEFCKRLSEKNPHWEKAMKGQDGKTIAAGMKRYWHSSMGHQKDLYALENPGKARMAQMMQLVADTYLSLAMIYRSLDSITPAMVQRALDEKLDKDLSALRTSGACKQNVDRGVVENISLRLFFRWAHNSAPLTQDEVYEIGGAVLGRARLVGDRTMIARRYQILDDLLRFVGSAQGGVFSAHTLLRDFQKLALQLR